MLPLCSGIERLMEEIAVLISSIVELPCTLLVMATMFPNLIRISWSLTEVLEQRELERELERELTSA